MPVGAKLASNLSLGVPPLHNPSMVLSAVHSKVTLDRLLLFCNTFALRPTYVCERNLVRARNAFVLQQPAVVLDAKVNTGLSSQETSTFKRL